VLRIRVSRAAALLLAGILQGGAARAVADQQHGIGLDYQLTHVTSKEGSSYLLQSPGISYLVLAGHPWAFQGQLTALFPVAASEDGVGINPGAFYVSRVGLDAHAGVARRFKLGERFEGDLGLGAHLNGILLTGRQGYRHFSSFTLGLGATAGLRYAPWGTAGAHGVFGAFASGGLDFIDLIHGGDLRLGDMLTAGLLAAWSFG
jgi:hypothetical protein